LSHPAIRKQGGVRVKRLLIVGASNFGREVLDWALAVPPENRDWQVGGFLDNRSGILDGFDVPYPNLGDPETFSFGDNDRFLCAVGDPKMKLHYGRQLKSRGATFVNLIHPSATVGSGCRWGESCILCPGAIITNHVTLGDFVTLDLCATVAHNSIVGDGCTLSCHAGVTGWAVLGEGVFLGSHAAVLPKVHIADYTVVGAGAIVLKNTEPHTTVVGVPARQIA
jgi:sugar O-acyltransferase (sialic acid O-acetyltransferase NeuD family)